MSDAYALVKGGKMGADQLVRLLAAYKGEVNSTVWKAVAAVLLGLDKVGTRGEGDCNSVQLMTLAEKTVRYSTVGTLDKCVVNSHFVFAMVLQSFMYCSTWT